jgi:hypothetical protein
MVPHIKRRAGGRAWYLIWSVNYQLTKELVISEVKFFKEAIIKLIVTAAWLSL